MEGATHDPFFGRKPYDVDIVIRAHGDDDRAIKLATSLFNTKIGGSDSCAKVHLVLSGHRNLLEYHKYDYVHATTHDYGPVRAANVGLWLSYLTPAPYVMFLDDDVELVEPGSDWLDRMIVYMTKDSQCGVVGATSCELNRPQTIQDLPKMFVQAWAEPGEGKAGHAGDIAAPFLRNFACLWRKAALKKVKGPDFIFDERLEPGPLEDLDMCLRLRREGYLCVVAQDVHVEHKGSGTYSKLYDRVKLQDQAMHKLIRKWGAKNLQEMGVEM